MAVSTVSTFSVVQSTLNDVSRVEGLLQQEQGQLSSGNAAANFSDMASNVQQYLSLDGILSRTNQHINDNQIIETRVNTTATVLTQIISTATDLQNLISQRRSGVANSAAFGSQLQGIFQNIAGQLNTQVGDQFLFSGSKIGSPAIDSTRFPSLPKNNTPDSSYYLGSQQDLISRPQDNVSIVYNVRGDAQGFKDVMAGLALAKQGDSENNLQYLSQSYDLVVKGLSEITNIAATVNANKVLYTQSDTFLNNTKLYYQGIQQTIGNTDLVSVSTQVATNQAILQAAFSVYAKLSSLRLSDYLK